MHFQIIIEFAVRYLICILNKINNWLELERKYPYEGAGQNKLII